MYSYQDFYTYCSACSSTSENLRPNCKKNIRLPTEPPKQKNIQIKIQDFAVLCISDIDLLDALRATRPNETQLEIIYLQTNEFNQEIKRYFDQRLPGVYQEIGNITFRPGNFSKSDE